MARTRPFGRLAPDVLLKQPGPWEGLTAAGADVAHGLGVLDAVPQQVQLMLKSSAALALVRALAPVEVAVADDEGGLPENGATLPAGERGLGPPAHVHTFCPSQVVAAVLEHRQDGGRRRGDRLDALRWGATGRLVNRLVLVAAAPL